MPTTLSPTELARGLLQIQIENAVRSAAINGEATLRLIAASLSAAGAAAPGNRETSVLGAAQAFNQEAARTLTSLWHSHRQLASSTTSRTVQLLSGEGSRPHSSTIPPSSTTTPSSSRPPVAGSFEVRQHGEGACLQLKSDDGAVLMTSRDYPDERSAGRGLQTVLKNAANPDRFARKSDERGQHFFQLKAGNNRLLATSPPFDRAEDVETAIDIVIRSAGDAAG